MANINSVTVSGNLTRDPELRQLPNGDPVCNVGIANNRWDRSKNEEVPNFFDVTIFGKAGENVAKYLSKGSGVVLSGKLRYESWEKDGQKRSKVSIVAHDVQFTGGKTEKPEGETWDFTAQQKPAEESIPF